MVSLSCGFGVSSSSPDRHNFYQVKDMDFVEPKRSRIMYSLLLSRCAH